MKRQIYGNLNKKQRSNFCGQMVNEFSITKHYEEFLAIPWLFFIIFVKYGSSIYFYLLLTHSIAYTNLR